MINQRITSILSSSLGNILEWYDFGLFTIFSPLFSRIFFPSQNEHEALLATFGIFAVGFICRPVGALIFGYLGDKKGRAYTLRLSILMITLPTLLIGFIPSYAQIGWIAPGLLLITRMWQGLSIGGEYSGNLIYLAESAPLNRRALLTSLASTGANVGILLAMLVGVLTSSIFTDAQLSMWGWRAAYLMSGLLSWYIYATRLKIQETKVFDKTKKEKVFKKNPIKLVFTQDVLYLLRTLGMVCMGTTFYYFCFVYLPIFLHRHANFSMRTVSMLMTCAIMSMIFLIPLAGFVCDYLGRRKLLLFNSLAVTIIIIPAFFWLNTASFIGVFLIMLIFTALSSFEQGTTSIAVVENFPIPARYTGLSFGYNLGNGFLGGTVPLICEWLVEKNILIVAPAIYIAACACITFIVVFFFVPESKNKKLTETNLSMLA